MSSVSKIPKNEQKEKVTLCKTTVIPSKTKNNTTEEGKKATQNVATNRKSQNLKNVLPPSKVPTRLKPRTSCHLKTTTPVMANETSNKNECYSNSCTITSQSCSKHPFPSSEDKADSNVPRKKSCFMRNNSELQNNLMKNISHSRTSYPSKSEKGEMKFHGKHTIQPERMLPKKGILKVNSRNGNDLKIRLSEGDFRQANPKEKCSETEKTSKLRKVTFKTLSLNDLATSTEVYNDLKDVKDVSCQECTEDEVNKELDQYYTEDEVNKELDQNCTEGEMKKELDHQCTVNEKNNELHHESITGEKKKVESLEEKQNYDFIEKHNPLELDGDKDCEREKNLLSFPLEVITNRPIASSKILFEENLRKNRRESIEPEVQNSSSKGKQPSPLKLNSNAETLKHNNPIQKRTEKCVQKLKTDVDFLPTEKTSEQSYGKRESIKKQVNEKIRILTAEFLKCIKEKNRKIPRSVMHNRRKSRTDSPQPVTPFRELPEKTTDAKTRNVKNDVSQASVTTSNIFQPNTETLAGSREKSILQTGIERCSRYSLKLNQGQGDELTSLGISRIPRPVSSKRESLSVMSPVDQNSEIETPEKGKRFSSPINQNVVKNKKILTPISQYNEQTLSETDKVAILVKEFDNLHNVPECADGRLKESKRSRIRKHYLKKNKSCEKLNTFGKIRNSPNFHSNSDCSNINILKKFIDGSKYNNKQAEGTNNVTKCNDKEEEAKGNFCNKSDYKMHSLEGDNVIWPKASYSLKSETPSSHSASEDSGSENVLQFKHKENNSEYKNCFSRHKKKLCFLTLIFLLFILLFMNFLAVT